MKQLITLCTAVLLIFTASAQTENLGPNINSKYHEIRPTASANGNVLYFTVEGNPLNPFKDGQDIWVSYRDSNGLWGKSERLPAYINTERYNGVFWTSADGNSIMIRGSRDSSGIVHRGFSMVKKVNGMWGYPVSINIRNYDWMSKGRYTGATLSVDETQEITAALMKKYPQIHAPKRQDICYATQNRQDAVKAMLPHVDVVIVVGSQNSSNSKRLQELASSMNVPAYLVDDPRQIQAEWFQSINSVGVTAGASAPEALTAQIIEAINGLYRGSVVPMPGIEETVNFSLPKGLLEAA